MEFVNLDVSFMKLMLCIIMTGVSASTMKNLILKIVQVQDNGASLLLEGLDIKQVEHCKYIFMDLSNQTNEFQVRPSFYPKNRTIYVDNLHPSTQYMMYLSCHSYANEEIKSQQINFTTANAGDKYDVAHSDIDESLLTVAGGFINNVPIPTTSIVTQGRMKTIHHPVDIALGIVFGLVALGIVCTVGYYLLKKLRRRQRIRRFLQYRQQENDPFPDIDPDDHEDDEGGSF